jgi:hypothetical protein
MRRKLITALCLTFAFVFVFGTQVAATAKADTKNGNPLTSPITCFQISGKVTYKFFKVFFHEAKRFSPASGVTVSAENFFTHDIYQATTDSNGNYSISVEEPGLYSVKSSGGKTSMYISPIRMVRANKGGTDNHVDFQGFVF